MARFAAMAPLAAVLALAVLGRADAGRAATARGRHQSAAPYLIGRGIGDCTGPSTEVNFMGYAQPTQTGQGIRDRLWARAFVFVSTSTGKRLAFVSQDAGMAGQLVTQRVVEALQAKYGADMYTYQNVVISGTHSHSGPAGFLQYVLYDITSLGFVEQTLDAFVSGIVAAIEQAHDNATPGNVFANIGRVEEANINRSPTAYVANPASERALYPEGDTDKNMTLLRMESVTGAELGMLNWFAVHGTSLNNTNRLVSADNKGFASVMFETWKNPAGTLIGSGPFVGAFAQSNLGDVSPNVNGTFCQDTGKPCDVATSTCNGKNELCVGHGPGQDMYDSASIIGKRQFFAAAQLYDQAKTVLEGPVDSVHTFVDMTNVTIAGTNKKTCVPAMGAAFAAGTTDGPGAFNFKQGQKTLNPFWKAVRDLLATPSAADIACQAPKPILLATGRSTVPYAWDPEIVPTQISRVGQLFIIAVPGEFTTMAGRRLRAAVAAAIAAAGGPAEPIVVIAGLSNTYASYITTYEEYQVQRYEAASTIYGPHTLEAYIQTFTMLATSLVKGTPVPPGPTPPDLQKKQLSFLPGVIVDGTPSGKSFGDVVTPPAASYKAGATASAVFVSADPRNNLMLGSTYLTVERQQSDGSFKVVATDANWETQFKWERHSLITDQSFATITWEIPADTPAGTYRLGHAGYYKHLLGHTQAFSGHSGTFTVSAP